MLQELWANPWIVKGFFSVVTLLIMWLVLRWKKMLYAHFMAAYSAAPEKHNPATLRLVFKILTIVIVIITTLIILQILGVNVIPLLAFGGIGAAALGFAAKDVLANFFGGLMLFFRQPFTEGDGIYIYKEEIEGIVQKIGWFSTTLRDKNKCLVILPNSLFSTALVINRSSMSHRIIEETLDIRYEEMDQIPALVEELRKAITHHPEIDNAQPVLIGVDNLGQYAFHIRLQMFTRTTQENVFIRIRQEILLKIYAILKEHNITMSFPTQTVVLSPNLLNSKL